MSKKPCFVCHQCGHEAPQWSGRCMNCSAWNSLAEKNLPQLVTPMRAVYRSEALGGLQASAEPKKLSDIPIEKKPRISTQNQELDRVLGGGLVAGSVILIGGDPGVGKSTLLLQTLVQLSETGPVLYVTAEESLQQVGEHARRMGLQQASLEVLALTSVDAILKVALQKRPAVMVIDSIQTVFVEEVRSAPGGVSQVRESALQFVCFAKHTNTVVFLVGHVTKEGTLAGPRVLEHMVDTVLYFEGEKESRWRLIRSVKNRFGAVNELGVFAMTDKGLKAVSNPSALFLSRVETPLPGSTVMVAWEGTRPILVEVQALVDTSHLANPRRVAVGWEGHRLAMLLAVLHRHGQVATYDQDIFINVVGGLRISETAADLALLLAIMSSLRNRTLPQDWVVFGEVGLGGEVRPVARGLERIQEACKHGFKRVIMPQANAPKQAIKDIEICPVSILQEALEQV